MSKKSNPKNVPLQTLIDDGFEVHAAPLMDPSELAQLLSGGVITPNEARAARAPDTWRFDYTYKLPFTPRGMTVIVESTVVAPGKARWGDNPGTGYTDETYFLDGDEAVFAKATTKWSTQPWGQGSSARFSSQLLSQVTALWLSICNEFLPQPLPAGFLKAFSAGQYSTVERATSKLIIIRDLETAAIALSEALEAQAALFLASDAVEPDNPAAVTEAFPVDNLFQAAAIKRHER